MAAKGIFNKLFGNNIVSDSIDVVGTKIGSLIKREKISKWDYLEESKEKARRDGQEIGYQAFKDIRIKMDSFIFELRDLNRQISGEELISKYIGKIAIIEKKIDELRNEVINFIGNRVNERLVTNDAEMSSILSEPDDKKFIKSFDAFYKKIYKQAIAELNDKKDEVAGKFLSLMDAEILRWFAEEEQLMQNDLAESSEKSKRLASEQVYGMYVLTVADIMLDELNSIEAK